QADAAPPPPAAGAVAAKVANVGLLRAADKNADPPMAEPMAAPMAEPMAEPAARERRQAARRPMPAMDLLVAEKPAMPLGDAADDAKMKEDKDWDGVAAGEALPLAPVRVFPAPVYRGDEVGPRTDFRQTIHWAPTVRTGKDGGATVTFYLSDAVTSFRVFAEGMGGGQIGRAEQVIASALPFSMAVKLPLQVSQGDKLELPLTLTNEQAEALPVSLSASFGDLLTLDKPVTLDQPSLAPNARASLYYPVTVSGTKGESKVMFSANAGGLKDEFVREVVVSPRGFPQLQESAGTLAKTAELGFDIGDAAPDAVTATLKFYPSPVSTLVGGLEGLIREPSGCFEQTSSSNYPNVMVLQYLQSNDVADPALVERTNRMIDSGYNRLVSFETKAKGYEWFGHSPPHEALTAYGVLEFIDMQGVYGGVDRAMVERTVSWLKGRRDGKGGFQRDGQALDSFGRAAPEVTDAYITYAVSEAGLGDDFPAEIARQAKVAQDSQDAYLLALACNTLLNLPGKAAEADAALARLAALQGQDGAWTKADHSITRSTGVNLHIETTALAALALMERPQYAANVRAAVEWLSKNRSGFGRWGATQSTVLALKAMTQYTVRNRATPSDGSLTIKVNGVEAEQFNYKAGRREPIVFTGLGKHFKAGQNAIEIVHTGDGQLPYSVAVEYVAMNPATHPEAPVAIETKLATDTLKMGENVRLTATVKNTTAQGQPMTLARVGLPGGLTFQNWQLKELVEKKQIAFFETGPREVILYFRELKPSETLTIPLDLVALVPGEFQGPASSAYLYYTDDKKFWAKGLNVKVNR
ncbi:MAG: hypothetical protein KC613_03090, partial [Myxococcales bacterium]|nr:hypothetical protein [Myxococcales bacterium]